MKPSTCSLVFVALVCSACAETPAAPVQPPVSPVEPASTPASVPQQEPQPVARPAEPVAAPSASATTPAAPKLRWHLEISPARMNMAGRARCRVKVAVTNEGDQAVAPPFYQGRWTVDGQDSMAAGLAFGNGTMDQKWMSLPPKQTATTERELCEALFPKPGKYTLGLQIGSEQLTAIAEVTR